jgi:hypothetical protein
MGDFMAGQVARTTPSVIIGMGGSGDWVLRQVKEALHKVDVGITALYAELGF